MRKKSITICIALSLTTLLLGLIVNVIDTDSIQRCEIKKSTLEDTNTCLTAKELSLNERQKLTFGLSISPDQKLPARVGFIGRHSVSDKKLSIVQIDISEITNGYHSVLITVGGRALPNKWEVGTNLKSGSTNRLLIEIEEQRRLRVWSNGELVYGFRLDVPITEKMAFSTNQIILDEPMPALEVEMLVEVESRTALGSLLRVILLLLSFISILLCFVTFGTLSWKRKEVKSSWMTNYYFISAISVGITLLTIIQGKFNLLGKDDYFDRNGITYARAARFSDWHQLRDLAQFGEPYLVGNSQYPPAFLGLFKTIPMLASGYGLFLMSMICTAVLSLFIINVFNKKDLQTFGIVALTICISYPFLYSFDRGSSEFVLVPLFAVFVWLISVERLKSASFVLGVMIGLKVFPIIFLPLLVSKRTGTKNLLMSLGVAAIATTLGSLALSGNPVSSTFQFLQVSVNSSTTVSQARVISERSTSLFQWIYSLVEFFQPELPVNQVPPLLSLLTWILSVSILTLVAFFYVKATLSLSTKLIVLTITTLILIPLSYDYRLLWLYPVLAIWLVNRSNSIFRYFYVIAFGVLFAARPLYFVTDRLSIGSAISFPILLSILIVILYENLNCVKPDCQNCCQELESSKC